LGLIIESADNGNKAKVDEKGRLKTFAISEGYSIEAAELGESFNINSGTVTLTGNATTSAVAYFKNEEDKDFVIENVLTVIGGSTGGTGNYTVRVIKNPTTGTIVSGAVGFDTVVNRNFGSARGLGALSYKGAEGNTITDGVTFANTIRTSASVIEFDADVIVLPKNSSIGIEVTTQAGNSSMDVTVALVGFLFSN